MSGHGGKRAGAGRKEGGKNKRQTKVTEAIEKQLTKDWATEPLDVMKEAIDEPKPQRKDFDDAAEFLAAYIFWFKTRFEAAKAAAPYRHARIAVSEQDGNLPEHERYLIEDRRDGWRVELVPDVEGRQVYREKGKTKRKGDVDKLTWKMAAQFLAGK